MEKFLLLVIAFFFLPSFAWTGRVVHVADGDTFTALRNHERVKVHLYGIDTPESAQRYGLNAYQFASVQIIEKRAWVDKIDVDRYGQEVSLVYLGNLLLNRHLIEYGYAWVYHRYCKRDLCSELVEVETQAGKIDRVCGTTRTRCFPGSGSKERDPVRQTTTGIAKISQPKPWLKGFRGFSKRTSPEIRTGRIGMVMGLLVSG